MNAFYLSYRQAACKWQFNYYRVLLPQHASKPSLSILAFAILFMALFSEKAFAQNLNLPSPDRCVSQDMQVVGATLSGTGCVTCKPGDPLSSELVMTIYNATNSLRTAFAFYGTLVIKDANGNTKSTRYISDCNDGGFPGREQKSFTVKGDEISYVCGDQITITSLYLAWTDASDGNRNMCPLDPSKIAPKCGTLQELKITTPLSAIATGTNVSCFGGNTGSATVTVSGGTGPYTYSWSPSGGTGATASNLVAGTYTVTLKDAKGCTTTASYTVTEPSALVAGGSVGTIACYGGTTTLTATATGGTGPYQYSTNGTTYQSSPTFTVNAAGSPYTVHVKDANQCIDTYTPIIVTQPAALVASVLAGTIACDGGTTTLTAIATGGTAPYQFSINGGAYQASPTFTVEAGTYTIRVKDAKDCTDAAEPITISQPPVLVAPVLNATQPTCTVATGSITVTAPTGTGFEYSINGGTAWQTSPIFKDLIPGNYSVIARNAAHCISAPKSVTINQPPATPVAPILNVVQPTCTAATGSITVTAPVGEGLQYSINDGAYQAGTTFNNLAPGTYNVTVRNEVGCISTDKSVRINPQPVTPIAPVLNVTQPNCTVATGAIMVTAPLGTGLEYSINGGVTWQTGATFNGLTAGNYSIVVRNATYCVSPAAATVIKPQLVTPGTPTVQVPTHCGPGTIALTSTLGANGTENRWYTAAIGGAPVFVGFNFTTPSLSANTTYYVSSANANCEGPRIPVLIPYVPCAPCVNRTQTQGGWGAVANGNNNGAYMRQKVTINGVTKTRFAWAFPSGVVIGDVVANDNCNTGKTLTLTSADAVTNFLPSGSTAMALDKSYVNPTEASYSNVLAGQITALTLSIRFDNILVILAHQLRC